MRRNRHCHSIKHQSQGQRIKKRPQGIVCSCSSPRTLVNQHCMLKRQHWRDHGFKRSGEHCESKGKVNVTTFSSTRHQVFFLILLHTFFEGINWRKGKGLKDLVNCQHCILIEKTSNFFKQLVSCVSHSKPFLGHLAFILKLLASLPNWCIVCCTTTKGVHVLQVTSLDFE